MSTDVDFDIIDGFNKTPGAQFDPQELVNLYVDIDPQGKKGKACFNTPGLDLDAGINFALDGKGRALYVFDNKLYAVIKDTLYSIDSALTRTFVGNLNTAEGYVGIADNGSQIIFVDGTDGWLLSGGTFSPIVSAGFPSEPIDIEVLANRFLVANRNSQTVHFSALGDGSSWDALDFFNITAYPDVIIGLQRLAGRLFIMGKRSTEIWYDAGTPTIPFQRASVLDFGCASVGTISSDFGFLIWLTQTDNGIGSVVLTTGTEPTRISSEPIEREFNTYTNISDGRSFVYKNEAGHVMYQINFTTANKSRLYDISQKRWSQLEYKAEDRHLAQAHAYFNGKHYVADYSAAKIYEMSNKFTTDNGVNIRRARVTPIFFDKNYRDITLNRIKLDLRQGTGVSTGEAFDPQLFISVSRNGGLSYGNQLSESIGKIGERLWETEFWRLGQARYFNFLIEHYNDVEFVLLGMSLNITIGEQKS